MFLHFKTIDELLALKPLNGEKMFILTWDPEILDEPIYQRKDARSSRLLPSPLASVRQRGTMNRGKVRDEMDMGRIREEQAK